jgi:hypothetical protein
VVQPRSSELSRRNKVVCGRFVSADVTLAGDKRTPIVDRTGDLFAGVSASAWVPEILHREGPLPAGIDRILGLCQSGAWSF